MKSILAFLIAGVTLVGCASEVTPRGNAGQVQHIVVCWLKPGADRAAVLHAANDFAKLPGVQDVSAGYGSHGDAAQPASDFDVAFVVTFDGESSLTAAQKNQTLTNIAATSLNENVAKSVVYDSALQNYQVGKIFTEENEAATHARRAAALKQQKELNDQTR